MRLLALKPSYATDEDRKKGVTVDGWRWALHADANKDGVAIGLHRGILHGNEWDDFGGEYFMVEATPRFAVGQSHNYYDGPHCSFSLGFVHICWSYWWCKKCMKDD